MHIGLGIGLGLGIPLLILLIILIVIVCLPYCRRNAYKKEANVQEKEVLYFSRFYNQIYDT